MRMEKIRRYIAYGSNLNLEQMRHRCPTAKVLGTAVMHGWALRFRGVATIERCKGAKVPVLVWSIQPGDEKALDRYEGWPHLYRKETVCVYLDGKQVTCMVYIMNGDRHPYRVPSSCYYDTIREGYQSFCFDTGVLDAAVEEASRIMLDERKVRDYDTES